MYGSYIPSVNKSKFVIGSDKFDDTVPVTRVLRRSPVTDNFYLSEATKNEDMEARRKCDDIDYQLALDDILELLEKDNNADFTTSEPAMSVMRLNEMAVANDVDKYFAQPPPYRPPVAKSSRAASPNLLTINMADLGLDGANQKDAIKQEETSLLLKYLTADTVQKNAATPVATKRPIGGPRFLGTQQLLDMVGLAPSSLPKPDSFSDLPALIVEPVTIPTTIECTNSLPLAAAPLPVASGYVKLAKTVLTSGSQRMTKRPSLDMTLPPSPPKVPRLELDVSSVPVTSDVLNTPDVLNDVFSLIETSDSDRISSDSERLETPYSTPPRSRTASHLIGSLRSSVSSRRSTPSPTGELARRERNNAASRRSRQNRKIREEEQAKLLETKEAENRDLKRKVDLLEAELQAMKQLMHEVLKNKLTTEK